MPVLDGIVTSPIGGHSGKQAAGRPAAVAVERAAKRPRVLSLGARVVQGMIIRFILI